MATRYDRRRFLATAAATGAVLAWPSAQARIARRAWMERPDLYPHRPGGHGYTVVRATGDRLEAEFVCIPRPAVRTSGTDGGPLRYRVRHGAALWKAGERPVPTQIVMEGDPALSI